MKDFAEKYTRLLQDETAPEREELISRAIKETVQLQWEAGLDVITDGEIRGGGAEITLIISVGS